jgi:hypothetical protein
LGASQIRVRGDSATPSPARHGKAVPKVFLSVGQVGADLAQAKHDPSLAMMFDQVLSFFALGPRPTRDPSEGDPTS